MKDASKSLMKIGAVWTMVVLMVLFASCVGLVIYAVIAAEPW